MNDLDPILPIIAIFFLFLLIFSTWLLSWKAWMVYTHQTAIKVCFSMFGLLILSINIPEMSGYIDLGKIGVCGDCEVKLNLVSGNYTNHLLTAFYSLAILAGLCLIKLPPNK